MQMKVKKKVKKTCNFMKKEYIYVRLYINQYYHDKNTRTLWRNSCKLSQTQICYRRHGRRRSNQWSSCWLYDQKYAQCCWTSWWRNGGMCMLWPWWPPSRTSPSSWASSPLWLWRRRLWMWSSPRTPSSPLRLRRRLPMQRPRRKVRLWRWMRMWWWPSLRMQNSLIIIPKK